MVGTPFEQFPCHSYVFVLMWEHKCNNCVKSVQIWTRITPYLNTFSAVNNCTFVIRSEAYSESSQTSKMEDFAKRVNSFQMLTSFAKNLHLICLTEFRIRFSIPNPSCPNRGRREINKLDFSFIFKGFIKPLRHHKEVWK